MVSRCVIIPSAPFLATVIWAQLFLFQHLTVPSWCLASSARLKTLVLLRVPTLVHLCSHSTVHVFWGCSHSYLQFIGSGLSLDFRALSRLSLPECHPAPPPSPFPLLSFTLLLAFHLSCDLLSLVCHWLPSTLQSPWQRIGTWNVFSGLMLTVELIILCTPNRATHTHTLNNASLSCVLSMNGIHHPVFPNFSHNITLHFFLHIQSFTLCLPCFLSPVPPLHSKYHYPGPRPLCLSPGLWPYLLVCVLTFPSCFIKFILLHTVARWISPKYIWTCHPLKFIRLQWRKL